MKKSNLAAAFMLAALLTLQGCGGGGGDSSPSPAPAPTPSAPAPSPSPSPSPSPAPSPAPAATGSITSTSGCTVASGQSTCNASASWTTSNANSPRLTAGGATVSTLPSGTQTFSVNLGSTPIVLSDGSTQLATASVVAGCGEGNAPSNGTCKSTYWNPAPVATAKALGANQLPASCTSWVQQCWNSSVSNGVVKFVKTEAKMTGVNNRTVYFAFFRNTSCQLGSCGLWNVLPFYADDGAPVGFDIAGGGTTEVDAVTETSNGVAFREKQTGNCFEVYWFQTGGTWATRSASCSLIG